MSAGTNVIDVMIEATGSPVAGIAHAVAAIEAVEPS